MMKQSNEQQVVNFDGVEFENMRIFLKNAHFYGETTMIWEDGELIMMTTLQKFKPKDFHKIVDK